MHIINILESAIEANKKPAAIKLSSSLAQLIEKKQDKIEPWFAQHWKQTPPPISSSVDLRNSDFKLAPVDTNLFPAGFNNLHLKFLPQATSAAKNFIYKIYPNCKNILIISESISRNNFYFENLSALRTILVEAGFNVRIGSFMLQEVMTIKTNENKSSISLEPLQRENDYLKVSNFIPELIFLNNDLSEGIPEILNNLAQEVNPPPQLGWHSRLKTKHFSLYSKVCTEFAELIDCDPWLFDPMFTECDNVNFMESGAEEELINKTEKLLFQIQEKYDKYDIKYEPYVVIKSNAGTYGMAVSMVKSAEDLKSFNRKQRKRMSYIKGSREVDKVIIQEGIYTFETCSLNDAVVEPVIYMLGQRVVGGFYRGHTERSNDENLNAPGMHFESVFFSESCLNSYHNIDHSKHEKCFYSYGVIARLALLAAAQELAEINTLKSEIATAATL